MLVFLNTLLLVLSFSSYVFAQNPYVHFVFQVKSFGCSSAQQNAEVELWSNSTGEKVAGPTLTNSNGEVDWPANFSPGYYTVKVWYPARPNDCQCRTKVVYFNGTDFWDYLCLGYCQYRQQ
jgi:hypothetical protein